ncbi:MAG: ribulose-phosphate 3-epimerase [Deltaproteobacteria bacterium]|nr:ribulose-phosphate 3-epimerase [Deltaproteobacteria bacterium]
MVFTPKIAPSLLSADFSILKQEIQEAEAAGASLFHVDVMDGHFVPNLTLGPFIVKAIRKCTPLPLDCHLMIESPERYVKAFAAAGANLISCHIEIVSEPKTLIEQLHALGIKAGLALNPDTPVERLLPYLALLDYVLVMGVFPGFAEQVFIESALKKIEELNAFRHEHALAFEIEVDGGLRSSNIEKIAQAGANIFVAGSAIFKNKPYDKTIQEMKQKIHGPKQ